MAAPDAPAGVDILIIGGGPAGAVAGQLLTERGHRTLILERDIHPRDHPGESLTPSTTEIFRRIGFLAKMEDAGFVHKPGACWTSPRAPVGRQIAIRLGEFPLPEAGQSYTYNVERDVFDAMLLRHAHENGVSVWQGVAARSVLFESGRAVGVEVQLPDGTRHAIRSKFVIDASGRRCVLGKQLRLRVPDDTLQQFCLYSWFRGVEPLDGELDGFLGLHFLGLDHAWAWQIPLRDGVHSIGIVTHRRDFAKSGRSWDELFDSLVTRSRNLAHAMRGSERIRPWWAEGDYSYRMRQVSGPGWVLIGDAVGFVDPIFSNGVDTAVHSARHAADAVAASLAGGDEAKQLQEYETRAREAIETWRELTLVFYSLQNLFTAFAVRRRYRESVVRILQGNLLSPGAVDRARRLVRLMHEAQEQIMADDDNLLRPGALDVAATGLR